MLIYFYIILIFVACLTAGIIAVRGIQLSLKFISFSKESIFALFAYWILLVKGKREDPLKLKKDALTFMNMFTDDLKNMNVPKGKIVNLERNNLDDEKEKLIE